MEKEKNNNNLVIGLIGVIILLVIIIAVGFPIAYNLKADSKEKEDNKTSEKDNKECNTTCDNAIDLSKIKSGNKNFEDGVVEEYIYRSEGSEMYKVTLLLNGKVRISYTEGREDGKSHEGVLSNVSNAIDIIQFDIVGPDSEQLIYVLDNNGEVYSYRIGDVLEDKLKADKEENLKNVKKLFIHTEAHHPNSGCIWYLIAIKDDNSWVTLNSDSV